MDKKYKVVGTLSQGAFRTAPFDMGMRLRNKGEALSAEVVIPLDDKLQAQLAGSDLRDYILETDLGIRMSLVLGTFNLAAETVTMNSNGKILFDKSGAESKL